jgi:hypothetical protein
LANWVDVGFDRSAKLAATNAGKTGKRRSMIEKAAGASGLKEPELLPNKKSTPDIRARIAL